MFTVRKFLTWAVKLRFEASPQRDARRCWRSGQRSWKDVSWRWWRSCSEEGCSSSGDPTWQSSCSSEPHGENSFLRKNTATETKGGEFKRNTCVGAAGVFVCTSLFSENTSLTSQFWLSLHHGVHESKLRNPKETEDKY